MARGGKRIPRSARESAKVGALCLNFRLSVSVADRAPVPSAAVGGDADVREPLAHRGQLVGESLPLLANRHAVPRHAPRHPPPETVAAETRDVSKTRPERLCLPDR